MIPEIIDQLLLVYATYLIATASPGPSNMAIMGTAMSQGRSAAMTLATGVLTGSMFWAALAATGIAALLATVAHALTAIRIAGGCYLLFLAYRYARSALSARTVRSRTAQTSMSTAALYRRGVLLHLANPKAILAWIAIMSLGLRPDAAPGTLPAILAGCAVIGVIVFGGYAVVFSTSGMARAYQRARRRIEGALAMFFTYAGLRLLLSRT